jgi:phosphoserine phosphatase
MSAAGARFASVIIDVDSTLSGIEGIDWLAARRGPVVERHVADLTDRAMRGEIALDAVYGERMAGVRPTQSEIAALASAYVDAIAPGAASTVARVHAAGVRVVLVSGGLRQAILPLAATLGIAAVDVHAVDVRLDDEGGYAGFDVESPLATQAGKPVVVAALALPRPVLAVGDGATDAALRAVVDAFAAYTGFVRRDAVIAAADHEVSSFTQLLELVLA